MTASQKITNLTVTILAEDTAGGMGTIGEHGFAALLHLTYDDGSQKKLLFDTGTSGDGLRNNARALGQDLHNLDVVVFSHGHYDHVWGITGVLPLADENAFLFCHPAALAPKWITDDQHEQQSLSLEKVIAPDVLAQQISIRTSREPVLLLPGVFTTGEIPKVNAYETLSEGLGKIHTTDPAGEAVVDMLRDDLSLIIQLADESIVIITGCCHAGLVNTLQHSSGITDLTTIRSIIGGLHLHDAPQERLDFTTETLDTYAIGELAACHCTGPRGIFALKTAFGEAVTDVKVGSVLEYQV